MTTFIGLEMPLGFKEGEDPRFSRDSAHECGKVVSPTHWPPVYHKIYPFHAFLLQPESTPGL
jgi:hypothetical protein